jgi:type III secretion protein U
MSDKTEQPTPKKLRDARKKGQVARSKEVVSTALLLGVLAIFWATLPATFEQMGAMIVMPSTMVGADFWLAVKSVTHGLLTAAAGILLPILVAVVLITILSHFFQFGLLLSFESMKPSLKKLNPGANIKNIVGKKNLLEFLKSLIKVVLLSVLILLVIRSSLDPLIKSPICGVPCVQFTAAAMLKQIVIISMAAFVVVAAADFVLQKRMHIKDLMMSKDEVKREYKEMEGDPHIKSARRHLHQELAMQDTVAKARQATVIVTNPTHIAVALFYKKDETPLPVVLAKAQDLLARRIVEMAREEGIPIMENVPLAQSLYNDVPVSEYIPSELIEPVAEVLRFVQSLRPLG